MQYKWTCLEHKEGSMDQLTPHIAPIISLQEASFQWGCVMQNGVTGKVYHFIEESQKWEEFLKPMPTATGGSDVDHKGKSLTTTHPVHPSYQPHSESHFMQLATGQLSHMTLWKTLPDTAAIRIGLWI